MQYTAGRVTSCRQRRYKSIPLRLTNQLDSVTICQTTDRDPCRVLGRWGNEPVHCRSPRRALAHRRCALSRERCRYRIVGPVGLRSPTKFRMDFPIRCPKLFACYRPVSPKSLSLKSGQGQFTDLCSSTTIPDFPYKLVYFQWYTDFRVSSTPSA